MDLIKIVAIGAPIALTVITFLYADRPPGSQKARYAWRAAFAAIAVLAVIAGTKQDDQLTAMLVGAKDDFPEVFGTPTADGTMRLFLSNAVGSSPLPDVTLSITKNSMRAIEPVAAKSWGTLLNGAWDLGINLKPGTYQINLNARNGWFIEILAIEECKGRFAQAFYISSPLNGGRILRKSQNDPDCFADFPKLAEIINVAGEMTYPLP